MADQPQAGSSGMDPKVAAVLCYLCTWLTGIIFLLIEKNDKTVRFHAWHAIFFALAVFAVWLVLFVVSIASAFISTVMSSLVGLFSILVWLTGFVLWIVLMVKAYQGSALNLPVITDLARKQAQK